MSWGVYWMFYRCPRCGKTFKSGVDTITEPSFGACPACHIEGVLVGESGKEVPEDPYEYEDTE